LHALLAYTLSFEDIYLKNIYSCLLIVLTINIIRRTFSVASHLFAFVHFPCIAAIILLINLCFCVERLNISDGLSVSAVFRQSCKNFIRLKAIRASVIFLLFVVFRRIFLIYFLHLIYHSCFIPFYAYTINNNFRA